MPSRYVCSVLTEMRTAVKVGRIDTLVGLIEEVQTLVNRMEAKLQDYADMKWDLADHRKQKRRYRELRDYVDRMEIELDLSDDDDDDDEIDLSTTG